MPTKSNDTKYNSPLNNPCLEEQNLSFKCLNDNNYDHATCSWYFENYKQCKKFWNNVMNDRRSKKISPILPPPEERIVMKKEHLEKLNKRRSQGSS